MDEQDLIAQFCGVTGASATAAQNTLASANGNLQEAVSLYYASQEGEDDDENDQDFDDEPQAAPQPTQQPAPSSSSSRKPPPQRKKQMTLDDIKKREEGGDDSEEEDGKKQNMFAGGEKSGLAVQNPGQGGGPVDHFKNIMNQARQNRERPENEDGEPSSGPAGSSNFAGRAQTLGGDDAPSQVIEDPAAMAQQREQSLPRVTRTLHLWADGISIDDGQLYRFDDPANQSMMAEINQGRAPLALLDVQAGQEVDLNLSPHKDENYVQPKKQYKPFGGSGQRLGSPTPGPASASAGTAQPSASSASNTTSSTAPSVDDSQPTVQLQIRLADGARLPTRFNTTQTIGDVYAFVNAAASTQRAYVLMTTFPSRELSDQSAVLGDMTDFKRGGVVVQKWV